MARTPFANYWQTEPIASNGWDCNPSCLKPNSTTFKWTKRTRILTLKQSKTLRFFVNTNSLQQTTQLTVNQRTIQLTSTPKKLQGFFRCLQPTGCPRNSNQMRHPTWPISIDIRTISTPTDGKRWNNKRSSSQSRTKNVTNQRERFAVSQVKTRYNDKDWPTIERWTSVVSNKRDRPPDRNHQTNQNRSRRIKFEKKLRSQTYLDQIIHQICNAKAYLRLINQLYQRRQQAAPHTKHSKTSDCIIGHWTR